MTTMSEFKQWPLWRRRIVPAPEPSGLPYHPEGGGSAPDGWEGPWPPERSTATHAPGDDGRFPLLPRSPHLKLRPVDELVDEAMAPENLVIEVKKGSSWVAV